jgi:hypothetical protein
VDPYITLTIWQVFGKEIKQVYELPCKSPDNNAVKSAKKLIDWMDKMEHENSVYIYGDPSGNNRNVIDENSASFFDKFVDELVKEKFRITRRIGKAHPAVSLSADFVNDIYENNYNGYSISISDSCKVSIEDYCVVKEAPDGTMLKIKVKNPVTEKLYEPYGHVSDTKRYFITELLKQDFITYKSRRKRTAIYAGTRG